MNLDYLQEYVTFCKYLNISEAARHLHLTQPTLSSHLQQVEKEVGAELIDRTDGFSLTPAGSAFVTGANELVQRYAQLLETTQTVAQETMVLSVQLNNTTCTGNTNYQILRRRFWQEHKNISFKIAECVDSTVSSALSRHATDCVIVYYWPIQSDIDDGIVFKRLPSFVKSRLYAWVSKANPLAEKESIKWRDLNNVQYTAMLNSCRLWNNAGFEMMHAHGAFPEPVMNGFWDECLENMGEDEVQLFDEAFFGIPAVSFRDDRVLIPLDDVDSSSEAYLAYRPEKVSPALRLLLDFMDTIEE